MTHHITSHHTTSNPTPSHHIPSHPIPSKQHHALHHTTSSIADTRKREEGAGVTCASAWRTHLHPTPHTPRALAVRAHNR
eukprot:410667-Rhodomonas_salina.1